MTKKINFPAFSVITYYGNYHPYQQQDYKCQASQLLAADFSAFLKKSEDLFLAIQNHKNACNWTSFKLDTAYLSHFLFFISRHASQILLEEYQPHIFFLCFMDCISLSHCMLISVVGYRPCTYTKCEKLIHSSLPPFFEFCPKLTIQMTQHTTTCFVLGHFTFPYNAKIKIVLQLQDTIARVCSIWNTAYNSVHTEKWKPRTNPWYITTPKHASQYTLHAHVHNAVYKLIVHSAQRTQYMLYSTGNSYFTWLRRLCIFCCTSAMLVFSASPINCQHMLLLSLSLWCMCRLSQISG